MLTLVIGFFPELKGVVGTHCAHDVGPLLIASVSKLIGYGFTVFVCLMLVYVSATLCLKSFILLFGQVSAVESLSIHDVEHALSVLVSHKKVFGALPAVGDGKSICVTTVGCDAM